ncbi:hypothetical protein PF011_g23097 [Phytophthora fragariae]|uniref:Uncharacterized protein n=1 Tax=Phytophthora fragariae TaxID=53985 RepID=A0A6A3IFC4_9STRA|nr:hypothetical protein PF011_g23097 [Phytophthora fragariae]KAE9300351.1 hypothetical protein PF008_g23023 [Phytophthora fragariae]
MTLQLVDTATLKISFPLVRSWCQDRSTNLCDGPSPTVAAVNTVDTRVQQRRLAAAASAPHSTVVVSTFGPAGTELAMTASHRTVVKQARPAGRRDLATAQARRLHPESEPTANLQHESAVCLAWHASAGRLAAARLEQALRWRDEAVPHD